MSNAAAAAENFAQYVPPMIEMTREKMNALMNAVEHNAVLGDIPTIEADRWLCRAAVVIREAIVADEIRRPDPNDRYAWQYITGLVTTGGTLRKNNELCDQLKTMLAAQDVNDYLWAKVREYGANTAREYNLNKSV